MDVPVGRLVDFVSATATTLNPLPAFGLIEIGQPAQLFDLPCSPLMQTMQIHANHKNPFKPCKYIKIM